MLVLVDDKPLLMDEPVRPVLVEPVKPDELDKPLFIDEPDKFDVVDKPLLFIDEPDKFDVVDKLLLLIDEPAKPELSDEPLLYDEPARLLWWRPLFTVELVKPVPVDGCVIDWVVVVASWAVCGTVESCVVVLSVEWPVNLFKRLDMIDINGMRERKEINKQIDR